MPINEKLIAGILPSVKTGDKIRLLKPFKTALGAEHKKDSVGKVVRIVRKFGHQFADIQMSESSGICVNTCYLGSGFEKV